MPVHLITFILCSAVAAAQFSTSIAVPLAIDAPDMRDGLRAVTVRWYAASAGGPIVEAEETAIDIQSGRTTLLLGLNSPLPTSLLERGHAWISVTFQGLQEPTQRYELLPNAFAQTSAYAQVAASLDPRATGLVTSINEVAGAVELIGENGLSVSRRGRQLVLAGNSISESGTIAGNGFSWEYSIRPATTTNVPLPLTCEVVSPYDSIYTTWRFDPPSGSYIITTSAVLLPDETIYWRINR